MRHKLTVFAAPTDDVRVVVRMSWTDALETIQVVDTRGVIQTRRNTARRYALVYICPTSPSREMPYDNQHGK